MVVFKFNTIEEFEEAFEQPDKLAEFARATSIGIQVAFIEEKQVADVYTIDILGDPNVYKVKIEKKEWKPCLERCLTYMEKMEMVDDVIDAYQLIQKL